MVVQALEAIRDAPSIYSVLLLCRTKGTLSTGRMGGEVGAECFACLVKLRTKLGSEHAALWPMFISTCKMPAREFQ